MLLLLVGGIMLPAALYALFDRWAGSRLRLDGIALASRYGGFMNSWAVFGRHATEYRDIRPIFPAAQAAELARFHDGTATIAARFGDAAAAAEAAEKTFGSFAAAGLEYADAGLSFQTGSAGQGGYARGQWLLIGDTLFAFYGPSSAALAKRRRATPALRARRFPGPLRLLHSRGGHCAFVILWVVASLVPAGLLLEKAIRIEAPAASRAIEPDLLRARLAATRLPMTPVTFPEGAAFWVAAPPDDLRSLDLDHLSGRPWITGLRLDLDAEPGTARVSVFTARPGGDAVTAASLRWHDNMLLQDSRDPMVAAIRAEVLAAGWAWQPRIWPDPSGLPGAWLWSGDWLQAWSRL